MVLDTLYLEVTELVKTEFNPILQAAEFGGPDAGIVHFDLWAEQTEFLEEGTQMPFPLPALFFEFLTDEIENLGNLSRNWPVIVNCYFADFSITESFDGSNDQATALKYLKTLGLLDGFLHGSNIDSGTINSLGVRRFKTNTNLHVYQLIFGIEVFDESSSDIHRPLNTEPANFTISPDQNFEPPAPSHNFGEGFFVDL